MMGLLLQCVFMGMLICNLPIAFDTSCAVSIPAISYGCRAVVGLGAVWMAPARDSTQTPIANTIAGTSEKVAITRIAAITLGGCSVFTWTTAACDRHRKAQLDWHTSAGRCGRWRRGRGCSARAARCARESGLGGAPGLRMRWVRPSPSAHSGQQRKPGVTA